MTSDLDDALLVILGGGCDPGVDPIGVQNRIEGLPHDVRTIAETYIERTLNIPLPRACSLSEIGDKIEKTLSGEMPELSDLVRTKLANYYTYQWR